MRAERPTISREEEDELELHAFLLLGPDRVEEVKLAAVRRGEVVRVVG